MSYYDELLEYCNEYKHVYCYGAGDIGKIVKQFLNKYEISIKGYIETQKSLEYLNGVKVYSLEEIGMKLNNEVGIVLSLDEKHHDTVLRSLCKYNIQKVFFITSTDIGEKIKPDLIEGFISYKKINSNLVPEWVSHMLYHAEKNKKYMYEKKYIEISNSYKKIVIGSYNMMHIGAMCMTYYLWNFEREEDTLYVMYPLFLNDDPKKIPNIYFFNLIQKKIEIITEENYGFWKWMIKNHVDKLEFTNLYAWEGIKKRAMNYLEVNSPLFSVDLSEDEYKIIELMNLKKEYICVHNRDNKYYEYLEAEQCEFTSMGRNFSVKDFNLMASEFSKKNINVVRMGNKVEECADGDIIDYATKYRTDKLDFYLLSKCKFFMVSNSGIIAIPILFQIPIILVNTPIISCDADIMIPLSTERDLMIMKKIWYSEQERYLTLDEILYMESKYRSYEIFEIYYKSGMFFENNSPEELLDVANEMERRLNGDIIYTEEEEELQKKYRTILERNVNVSKVHFFNGRFGTDFLRKNSWFLEDIPDELSIKSIL